MDNIEPLKGWFCFIMIRAFICPDALWRGRRWETFYSPSCRLPAAVDLARVLAGLHGLWLCFFFILSFFFTSCVFPPPISHHLPPLRTVPPIPRGVSFVRTNSPTETPSLDAPLRESLSPSPTQAPDPPTQNRKEKVEEEDGGDRMVSVPCYEIHATGLRRCSEPLTFNLPPPRAEPPAQTLSHLIVSSEQRFLFRDLFSLSESHH